MIEDQIVRATALKKVISVHSSLLLYTLDRLMMMVPMMKRLPILIYRGKMKTKKVCRFCSWSCFIDLFFFPHPPSLPLFLSVTLSLFGSKTGPPPPPPPPPPLSDDTAPQSMDIDSNVQDDEARPPKIMKLEQDHLEEDIKLDPPPPPPSAASATKTPPV